MRGALGGTGAHVIIRRGLVLAALALLAAVPLAGCGADLGNPYAALSPGPTPPSRPGSFVWICGAPDLVIGSADGGATWQERHRRPSSDIMEGDLWAIAFGDVDHGWAVRRGIGSPRTTILVTADAGVAWSYRYPGPKGGRLLSVAATDARHVWAAGYQRLRGDGAQDKGLVLASGDGGATWTRQRLPAGLVPFRVAFGDARHGWMVAGDADHVHYYVLSTGDGGAHWRVSYRAPDGVGFSALAAAGARRCWAVGSSGAVSNGFIASTSDGGRRWRAQASVSRQPLAGVSFPDEQHGWAVGAGGTVLATSDGGSTWTPQKVAGDYGLAQVSFSDRMHGWALISHMALLCTIDGGRSWSVVRPADTRDLLTGLAKVQSGPQ
jgi:photosystem II stability/assembly factor-like uncharacterized protein